MAKELRDLNPEAFRNILKRLLEVICDLNKSYTDRVVIR